MLSDVSALGSALKYKEGLLAAMSEEGIDCSICMALASDPVITPCGHFFCEKCLAMWLRRSNSCPSCKSSVPRKSARRLSSPSDAGIGDTGTRVNHVVQCIRRSDALDKFLVFTTYPELLRLISSALSSAGIEHAVVEGSRTARCVR